jgi:hypothetical protein
MIEQTNRVAFSASPRADDLPDAVVESTFADPAGLEDFWTRWYLDGFVDAGQGKVKVLVGRPGSGKTHFLQHFARRAKAMGYRTASVDAAAEKLASIDELYRAISRQMPWDSLVRAGLRHVLQEQLGYPEFTGPVEDFLGWVERERGLTATLIRRDVREAIDAFLGTIDLDGEFFLAIRSWMNQLVLNQDGAAAAEWLLGGKLGATVRKGMGLRSNVTRRNGRTLLASLAAWVHHLTQRGIVVLVDNIGVLSLTDRVEGRPYYTRAARDQSYEMMRELIDDSAFSPYLLTVIAGETEQVANSRTGFPSYPALWARLQSEVAAARPNLFGDLVDLDSLWSEPGEHGARLLDNWRDVEWTPDEEGIVAPEDKTLGLEWGRPRRVVADVMRQRAGREEGSA